MKRERLMRQAFEAAVAVALLVNSAVAADEWHVYSDMRDGLTGTQQLTNAFRRAQSGDTITIHPGVYNVPTEEMTFRFETDAQGTVHATDGVCLYSEAENLTVRGDPAADRSEIVLSGLGAAAETSSGQHQIMLLGGANGKVRHLTFKKGTSNAGYAIYRGGTRLNGSDSWVYRRGGALRALATTVVEDCVFEDCYAGQGACVYSAASATNCRFVRGNCVAQNNGCSVCDVKRLYDCRFTGCGRGSIRVATVVSNCVFEACGHTQGNGLLHYPTKMQLMDCAFRDCTTTIFNFTAQKYMASEVSRCTFFSSARTAYSFFTDGAAGVSFEAPITDCTFEGNFPLSRVTGKISRCTFKANGVPMMTACSQLEDCSVDAGGVTLSGTADLAPLDLPAILDVETIRRCRLDNFSCHWAYAIKNCHRMENSLVTRTVQWGGTGSLFGHTDGQDATYLNCTVMTNGSMNAMFCNVAADTPGRITLKNCLFCKNKVGGQNWGTCDSWTDDLTNVYLFNTYHRFKPAPAGSVNSVNGRVTAFDPRIGDDGTLHRLSCCVNAGDNDMWTAADVDLAGNSRVHGTVDVGCFENWDPMPGFLLLFR